MGAIPQLLLADAVTTTEVCELVADLTGKPVSRHLLRKLIKRGKVPAPLCRIGRTRIWAPDQLEVLGETLL